ncbi:MAG: transposase [Puniceicoccaceae bacterium 5H]|nr:MAG: transposase [Puniceicoccaceae bacterium 5H]
MSQKEVAAILEVNATTVSGWWRRYQEGGWDALKKRQRGFKAGTRRRLSPEQEGDLARLLTDHVPDQLKLEFALWTREAVRLLILERFEVEYALQSISVLLERLGFTPQRPIKCAYEQRPEAVKAWLDEVYPGVEAKAKAEGAEIYWADETAVKPEAHVRRRFAPKGKTPVVRQPARRFHSSVISAISKDGKWSGWLSARPLMRRRLSSSSSNSSNTANARSS